MVPTKIQRLDGTDVKTIIPSVNKWGRKTYRVLDSVPLVEHYFDNKMAQDWLDGYVETP